MAEQEGIKKQGDVYSSYEDALKDSGVQFISEEEALADESQELGKEDVEYGGERATLDELKANAEEEAKAKQETEQTQQEEKQETPVAEEAASEQDKEEPTSEEKQDGGRSFKFGNTKEESTTEDAAQAATVGDDDVLKAINEKFGKEFKSIEDLKQVLTPQEQDSVDPFSELPEDLKAAIKFTQETGRTVNDWVMYQSLNTSEMDDLNAVRLSYQLEYPDLTNEEREELITAKYHLDEDEYTEREVRIGKTNLKADGAKAKKEIERLRKEYLVKPVQQSEEPKVESKETEDNSVFDESWMTQMKSSIDELENLEFEDGKGGTLKYGITNEIKNSLKAQNEKVEDFFDKYINKDGSWNHDLFNAHVAVVNNIENIVREAVSYGMSKGQKELLERTTNASTESPRTGQVKDNDLSRQMEEIAERISGRPQMRIRI